MYKLCISLLFAASASAGPVSSVACGIGDTTQSASGGTLYCRAAVFPNYDLVFASISSTVAQAVATGERGERTWASAFFSEDVVVTVFGGTGPVTVVPCFTVTAHLGGTSSAQLGSVGYWGLPWDTNACYLGLDFVFGESQTLTFTLSATAATYGAERDESDGFADFWGLVFRDAQGQNIPGVTYSMVEAVGVPEPGTAWFLVIAAGLGLAAYRRRT